MCPWQRMDGQGPSGQCSPGQEWWIQLHQWIAVINRMVWRWSVTATRQPRAPGVASTERTGSGMQVNQAWPSQYYIWRCKVYALQSRWSALLSSGARRKEEKKKVLILRRGQRLGHRFIRSTRWLLSRRAKDKHRASRQVMALHCLQREVPDEMCCILVCSSA